MNNNHQKFLQHLEESKVPVMVAGQWLNKLGYKVGLPPASAAEKHEDWEKHADSGDLTIELRVEVKHLSAEFTGKEDWPFRDYIVCAKHSFDRANPRPYMYININKAMTHAGIVMGSHRQKWTAEPRTDRRYEGVAQECYIAPVDSVMFLALT